MKLIERVSMEKDVAIRIVFSLCKGCTLVPIEVKTAETSRLNDASPFEDTGSYDTILLSWNFGASLCKKSPREALPRDQLGPSKLGTMNLALSPLH